MENTSINAARALTTKSRCVPGSCATISAALIPGVLACTLAMGCNEIGFVFCAAAVVVPAITRKPQAATAERLVNFLIIRRSIGFGERAWSPGDGDPTAAIPLARDGEGAQSVS